MTTTRLLVALVLLMAVSAGAQSLAEVACQEKLRREALEKRTGNPSTAARVFTNADLSRRGRLPGRDGDLPALGDLPEASDDAEPDQEQEWRSRMNEARQALAETETRVEELQSDAARPWADFTARDDPAQRALLEQQRLDAVSALEAT